MATIVEARNRLIAVFNEPQANILAEVITDAYNELVKTSDFNELKGIVRDLSLAQKRTELRIGELAEAQKELAEAQKRTELKVEELVEAQKRTELKVEELVEAQKRTEKELCILVIDHKTLVSDHKITRQLLGGLTHTVGYKLEDIAYKTLPALLKKDFGLIIQGRLKRAYSTDNQNEKIEINIIGEAKKDNNGQKIMIVGESKSQLSKNDVNKFIRKKLKRLQGIYETIFPVLITYMISEPDVEEYTKEKGIALYYSYDLML